MVVVEVVVVVVEAVVVVVVAVVIVVMVVVDVHVAHSTGHPSFSMSPSFPMQSRLV